MRVLHRSPEPQQRTFTLRHAGAMAKTFFVDENKRAGFVFVGIAVDTTQVGRARSTMRGLLPRGARRVHFVKENRVRRRKVLATIAELDLTIVVICVPATGRPVSQRRAALGGLVAWALDFGIDRIVLEHDENSVHSDLRTISHLLEDGGRRGAFEYGHMPASAEPLLWIADALAWSWTRGGDWRERVEAMGVTRIDA